MKHLLCIITMLLIVGPAFSQFDNSAFYTIDRLKAADSNSLILDLNVLAFNKNNEYFNKIADGYTLFGYQLAPMLAYQAQKNFSIAAGVFIRKDFGDPGYRVVEPLFRFTYERDSMQLIFGNLNGALAHRLIEPLYDFDKAMTNPLENGIQARYFAASWWMDAWIDWQKMIYKGDPEQEEVTGGISFEKNLINKDKFNLSLPVQALVYHKGGQIDSSPEPLITLWNSAVGLDMEMKSNGIIKKWGSSLYYTYYKDFSHEKLAVFQDGEGLLINASLITAFDLQMVLSYWKGNEFISIMGGQLYPSVSSTFKTPDRIEPHRELLILRFSHDIHLFEGVYLTSRFEPYYDLLNETFEFSHGLYIYYRLPVPLLKNVRK